MKKGIIGGNVNESSNYHINSGNNGGGETSSQSLTLVAQNVSLLAQTVKQIQTQLHEIDIRIKNNEKEQQKQHKYYSSSSSTIMTIEQDKKKQKDFIKAYKSVMSIVKAFKLLPEIKEESQKTSSAPLNNVIIPGNSNTSEYHNHDGMPSSTTTNTLLRNIALTLSDVDTVASFVSNMDDGLSLTSIKEEKEIGTNHQKIYRRHIIPNDNEANDNNDINITMNHKKNHKRVRVEMNDIEDMLTKHSKRSFRLHLLVTLICCYCCCVFILQMVNTNNIPSINNDEALGTQHDNNDLPYEDDNIEGEEIIQEIEMNVVEEGYVSLHKAKDDDKIIINDDLIEIHGEKTTIQSLVRSAYLCDSYEDAAIISMSSFC